MVCSTLNVIQFIDEKCYEVVLLLEEICAHIMKLQ